MLSYKILGLCPKGLPWRRRNDNKKPCHCCKERNGFARYGEPNAAVSVTDCHRVTAIRASTVHA